MLPSLNSRVALVTGASRGIGKAIALALANAGANVAVNYRERNAEAEETVTAIKSLEWQPRLIRRECSPYTRSPAKMSQGFTGSPLAVALLSHVAVTYAGLSIPASKSSFRKFQR